MRFVALLGMAVCLITQPAAGDGFSTNFQMPAPIDVNLKRDRLISKMPFLERAYSRSAISAYRQEIDRYNSQYIQGLYAEIKGICEALNVLERDINQEWDRGNISPNEKADWDDQIKDERQKCSDRHASTSPYFILYYEIIAMYKKQDEESLVMLSECNSREECREN